MSMKSDHHMSSLDLTSKKRLTYLRIICGIWASTHSLVHLMSSKSTRQREKVRIISMSGLQSKISIGSFEKSVPPNLVNLVKCVSNCQRFSDPTIARSQINEAESDGCCGRSQMGVQRGQFAHVAGARLANAGMVSVPCGRLSGRSSVVVVGT